MKSARLACTAGRICSGVKLRKKENYKVFCWQFRGSEEEEEEEEEEEGEGEEEEESDGNEEEEEEFDDIDMEVSYSHQQQRTSPTDTVTDPVSIRMVSAIAQRYT